MAPHKQDLIHIVYGWLEENKSLFDRYGILIKHGYHYRQFLIYTSFVHSWVGKIWINNDCIDLSRPLSQTTETVERKSIYDHDLFD